MCWSSAIARGPRAPPGPRHEHDDHRQSAAEQRERRRVRHLLLGHVAPLDGPVMPTLPAGVRRNVWMSMPSPPTSSFRVGWKAAPNAEMPGRALD